jgi:methylenetetrahydrofolate dehydrogenase (NADP+)/methenyltetrahydrofolate cyclohydrolase
LFGTAGNKRQYVANILYGKVIAERIKDEIKRKLSFFTVQPKLVSVIIGSTDSSRVYMNSQMKAAAALGIDYETRELDKETNFRAVRSVIEYLNSDESVSAILLQLPVPKCIDHKALVSAISPLKDAEGMHPVNLGNIILGTCRICPCTASACMALLDSTGVDLYGKEAVIVGHSEIVGKPLSLMLINRFATTTVCHIATSEKGSLADHVRRADIVISAVGKPGLIKGEWIKEGAIIIDVGISKVGDKIVGDVEFDEARNRASNITPVPGGVGPITTMMLFANVATLHPRDKS